MIMLSLTSVGLFQAKLVKPLQGLRSCMYHLKGILPFVWCVDGLPFGQMLVVGVWHFLEEKKGGGGGGKFDWL